MNNLPKNWQVKSLGEVFELRQGKHLPLIELNDGSYPVFGANGLVGYYNEFMYKVPTLLVTCRGATCGSINLTKPYSWVTGNAIALIPKENVSNSFFYYQLINQSFKNVISGSAQPQIIVSTLSKKKILVPPLTIQKQIAEILEKADQAKQKRKEANKLTDEFLQSVFIEMFGDPVKNPMGWEVKKLCEVCNQITDGVHLKPNYRNEGIPFISVKDITTGVLKFDDTKFISKEDHEILIKRCKPEYWDILYTKVGATYGRAAIVNTKKDFSLYVSVALIKPNHKLINPFFLKEMMNSKYVKNQADTCIRGIGVPDLHLVEIKNFEIILPPLQLQQQFAEIVNKTEALKEKQKQSEQELENLFQSLMQKAFNGELM